MERTRSGTAAVGRVTRPYARAALTLLAAYVLLTAAAYWAGELYLAPWLPWLRIERYWLLPPGIAAQSLELATVKGDHVFVLEAQTTMPLAHAGRNLPAGLALSCSTLQAYALHHAVIVFSVLVAWPMSSLRQRIAMLALGIPCVLLTTSLDIPFVLAGLVQDLLLANLAPERLGADPRALYYELMHGGGRIGVALAVAVWVSRPRGSSDPR